MREEQVRRWQVWFNAQPAIKPRTQKIKFADFSVLFDDSGEDKVRSRSIAPHEKITPLGLPHARLTCPSLYTHNPTSHNNTTQHILRSAR